MPFSLASHVEHVGDVSGGWPIGIARRKSELDAIIGQNDLDLVGNRCGEIDEEG